jgi:hypothetical protein
LKLLVVGRREETHALVRLLRSKDRQGAAHVADGRAALRVLERPDIRFDFVLVEGGDMANGRNDVAEMIRRHRRVPIAILSYPADPSSAPPKLFGVFEKSPNGMRILNCTLAEPERGRTEGNCARDLGRIIYEYQPGREKGR